jgi:hypothetical protein
MSSLVLEHETFVALNTLENGGLFDLPGADVLPFFLSVLLLGVRGLPSRVIQELLEESCGECCWLSRGQYRMLYNADPFREAGLTVKVGFSTAELVTDSTTLSALLAASAAAEETEDAASSASSARSALAMAA